MYYDHRHTIRRQLESELRTGAARGQLSKLSEEFPIPQVCKSWVQVVECLLDLSAPDRVKHTVLQALLVSFQRGVFPECGAALLLAFWPALTIIAERRAAWNDDDDELWFTLEWVFLESARQLDVGIDPSNIAARLVRTTANRLRRVYRDEVGYGDRKVSLPDPESSHRELMDVDTATGPGDDSRATFVLVKQRVVRAYRSGLLSDDELRLLIEIDYEGSSLQEAAIRRGLPYGTLKKRRQRLLAKLRHQNEERRDQV